MYSENSVSVKISTPRTETTTSTEEKHEADKKAKQEDIKQELKLYNVWNLRFSEVLAWLIWIFWIDLLHKNCDKLNSFRFLCIIHSILVA